MAPDLGPDGVGPWEGPTDKDRENDTLPREELKNGPINNRGCTDILCLLVFVAFLVGMVGVAGYGYLYGDYQLLLTTFDSDGYGCGWNKTTKDYPFLYFPVVDLAKIQQAEPTVTDMSQLLSYSTCVKECPSADPKTEVK